MSWAAPSTSLKKWVNVGIHSVTGGMKRQTMPTHKHGDAQNVDTLSVNNGKKLKVQQHDYVFVYFCINFVESES